MFIYTKLSKRVILCVSVLCLNNTAWAATITRIDVNNDGSPIADVNYLYGAQAISADGRYVVFSNSHYDDLIGKNVSTTILHDLQTGTNLSIGVGYQYAMSANGQYVASLYSGGFTLFNRLNQQTGNVQVPFASHTNKIAWGYPSLSADGHLLVAPTSDYSTSIDDDIIVYDRQANKINFVNPGTNAPSYGGVISGNGRFVMFSSAATNLVLNDTNKLTDIFVRNLDTNEINRINVAADGTEANGLTGCTDSTCDGKGTYDISSDGRYVVFSSSANNLVAGDTNKKADVFVNDRQTQDTVRISVASDKTQANNDSYASVISGDGRFVVFVSEATNLVANTEGSSPRLYLHDRQTHSTVLIGQGATPSITEDGRYVVFNSSGAVYLYDRLGVTTQADLDVMLTPDLDYARLNTPFDITLTVTNNGPDTAKNVSAKAEVADIPALKSTTTGFSSHDICNLGDLIKNQQASCRLTFVTSQEGVKNRISTSATVSSKTHDAEPANNTASLTTAIQHQLIINKIGSGTGKITSKPISLDCGSKCSALFINNGKAITLTPSADVNSIFTGWQDDICEGTDPCSLVTSGDTTVTAKFDLKPIGPLLAITMSGDGNGKVTSKPAGIDCGDQCSAYYSRNKLVTLVATPLPDSTFAGWTGACTGKATCTVIMSAAKAINATFTKIPTYALDVTLAGTGTGRVTSSPEGINCGATCNADYKKGTVVTLTAKPSTSTTFTGWGGACTVKALTCKVTMIATKNVKANFKKK